MITISTPLRGARGRQYVEYLANDDYYANRHEKAGRWWGRGAHELGLDGFIRVSEFKDLCDGLSPDGKLKLVQNARSDKRQCGWDVTFSPPKSVSVFWAMAPPEARAKIEAAHRAAVEEALGYLQENAAFTRRGSTGKRQERASLVIGMFEHAASRSLDPDLHVHAFVVNVVLRKDGTWGTLASEHIFWHRFNAQQIYHLGLALRIRMDIGLSVQLQAPAFRIDCVPDELCHTCSKRRQAIEKFKAEYRLSGTAAGKLAALKTRPKKQHVSLDKLFSYWHRIGESHGWGPEQAKAAYQQAIPVEHEQADDPSKRDRSRISQEPGPQASATQSSGESDQKASAQADFGSSDGNSRRRQDSGRPDETSRQRDSESSDRGWRREESEWTDERSRDEQSSERRGRERVFRRERNAYRFQNPRWGEILWKKKLKLFEIRIQKKRMFPKAPSWSPASKLKFRAIRVVPKKSVRRESNSRSANERPKVHWKKNLGFGQLQWVDHQFFPNAPWSVARKLRLRRLRFLRKTPKSQAQSQSSESKKKESQAKSRQSHSH